MNDLNLNNTNIRQITNVDIDKYPEGNKAWKISIDTEPQRIAVDGPTPESTVEYDVIYATLILDNTRKFGYSCAEVARKLPIYIKFEGQSD